MTFKREGEKSAYHQDDFGKIPSWDLLAMQLSN